MDEYEVELIDYLRVIWKGKWIILACLVVALTVTASVMWTRPNEYTGTVDYRMYESLSGLLALDIQKLQYVIEAIDTSSLEKGIMLKVKPREDLVQVTLSGAVPMESLLEGFDWLTGRLHEQLIEHLGAEKSRVRAESELKIEQMARQSTLLEDRMTAIVSTDDPRLPYLAEKIIDLEALLVEEQAKLEILQETAAADIFTLETVGRSTIAEIGPNRKMALAVAGVLGLFCGVLLAFFVHYLMGLQEKELGKKGH